MTQPRVVSCLKQIFIFLIFTLMPKLICEYGWSVIFKRVPDPGGGGVLVFAFSLELADSYLSILAW